MGGLRIAFALLAAAGALAAQPLPDLRTEAVNAGSVFYVKNVSAQPLTAFLIELVDYPGSSYSLYQDDAAGPIAPGAEKRIPVSSMLVGAAPDYVKITAALYADSSTAGDPEKAGLIAERRKVMIDTTRELTRRIDKAQQAGTAKDKVVAELKQWADSVRPKKENPQSPQADVHPAAVRDSVANAAAFLQQHSIEQTLADLGNRYP